MAELRCYIIMFIVRYTLRVRDEGISTRITPFRFKDSFELFLVFQPPSTHIMAF